MGFRQEQLAGYWQRVCIKANISYLAVALDLLAFILSMFIFQLPLQSLQGFIPYMLLMIIFQRYDFLKYYAFFQHGSVLIVITMICWGGLYLLSGYDFVIIPSEQAWLSFAIFCLLSRKILIFLNTCGWFQRKVYVYGDTCLASMIKEELTKKTHPDWQWGGCIHDFQCTNQTTNILVDASINQIKLYNSKQGYMKYGQFILMGQFFYELLTRQIPISNKLPIISKVREENILDTITISLYNLAFAIVGLAVLSPIMLIIALIIKFEDGEDIFFKQTRIGYCRQPFMIYKFRTYRKSGDSLIKTKVGKIIRAIRLDELPQLFNILKRDINLVGPRPFVPSETEQFLKQIPGFEKRYMVMPGITGLAQVSHGYNNCLDDALQKLGYDLFYIKNRNLVFDGLILLRSVACILSGSGE